MEELKVENYFKKELNDRTEKEFPDWEKIRNENYEKKKEAIEWQKDEKVVDKVRDALLNPQFRDTNVPKTDEEKTQVAQDRLEARKILLKRGVVGENKQPVKKTEFSNTQVAQKVSQAGR